MDYILAKLVDRTFEMSYRNNDPSSTYYLWYQVEVKEDHFLCNWNHHLFKVIPCVQDNWYGVIIHPENSVVPPVWVRIIPSDASLTMDPNCLEIFEYSEAMYEAREFVEHYKIKVDKVHKDITSLLERASRLNIKSPCKSCYYYNPEGEDDSKIINCSLHPSDVLKVGSVNCRDFENKEDRKQTKHDEDERINQIIDDVIDPTE